MEISVQTSKREEILDITEKVEEVVSRLWQEEKKVVCNKKSRACLIFTPHTTCSIIINEINNENICEDILTYLRQAVPKGKWRHDLEEGNADSHIKASLMGNCKVIPLQEGKLMLGKWQKIGLAEFDGARERKIVVEVL